MRIVEEWSHQTMRLTVMIMNGKYSLKVEDKLLEQTYKFRDGQIEGIVHLKSLLTDTFFQSCQDSFTQMDQHRNKLFTQSQDEDSFAELI